MYEEKFDKVDISIKGKAIVSIVEPTIFMNYPTSGKGIGFNGTGQRIGYLTGNWTTYNGINYFQVEFENDFTLDGEVFHWGAANAAQFRLVDMGTNSGGQQLINNLIANNKTILENNLICIGAISKSEENGTPIPVEYKKGLYQLQNRLQARNEKILNCAFIESKLTASPSGFSQQSQQLTEFMNNPGIGFVVTATTIIVVSVVFTLLFTAVMYMIFSKSYNESKTDIVYSKNISEWILKNMPPEMYQQYLAENKEQATKIQSAASGSGIIKTLTYVAAGFLGFTLIDKFILNKK